MSQANSLALAKQGDPQAIAALINHSLQSKGVTVKAMLANGCLTLIAESKETVEKEALVAFIRKGLVGLSSSAIQRVVIQMREVGKATLAWREAFAIESTEPSEPLLFNPNGSKLEISVTELKAKFPRTQRILSGVKELGTPSLLVAILLVLISNRFAVNQPPAKPTIWEYQVVSVEDLTFDSTMQRLGSEGWEVASARRAISGEGESSKGLYELILKRPITEAQARENARNMEIRSKESMTKTEISLINLSQRSFYRDKSTFATDFTQLDKSSFFGDSNYTYTMKAESSKAIVTAAAKTNGLRNFTSGIFAVGSGSDANLLSAICISDSPSNTPPEEPQLNGAEITCPSGSTKVD